MISVYFIRNGKERIKVDVEPGFTLMEAAKKADIPEIPADCGGCCACGTCHVHVKTLDKIEPADYNSLETELLEVEDDYDRMTSRLSCQIQLNDKHNGLEVELRDNELL
ncbi:MAG: hypothetical protein CBC53_003815 [Alphaproteobacteria bacterium TMED93]|jgi:2Fe-2S ferredoxin|nr:hypothetical protein [Candidatus Pelagibacter sp.]RPH06251.1 MAG: hypothetical protein CBC53_003815 [Alphaproteobacteria bacterium TMED93]|tara:strand:+ start:701 stop:1027 length:327 start_codon:yes stop_codon:yes gene_type:complete